MLAALGVCTFGESVEGFLSQANHLKFVFLPPPASAEVRGCFRTALARKTHCEYSVALSVRASESNRIGRLFSETNKQTVAVNRSIDPHRIGHSARMMHRGRQASTVRLSLACYSRWSAGRRRCRLLWHVHAPQLGRRPDAPVGTRRRAADGPCRKRATVMLFDVHCVGSAADRHPPYCALIYRVATRRQRGVTWRVQAAVALSPIHLAVDCAPTDPAQSCLPNCVHTVAVSDTLGPFLCPAAPINSTGQPMGTLPAGRLARLVRLCPCLSVCCWHSAVSTHCCAPLTLQCRRQSQSRWLLLTAVRKLGSPQDWQ